MPTAQILANNNIICSLSSLSITANNESNTINYLWTGPNAFASNTKSFSINNFNSVNEGVYTLTVDNVNCSSTITKTITFSPVPTAEFKVNNILFCQGNDPYIYPVNESNTLNYSWAGPSNYSSTTKTLSIIGFSKPNSGSYTLTISNLYCSYTLSITLYSPPMPSASITINKVLICDGDELTINTINAISTDNYNWAGPNHYSNTTPNISITQFSNLTAGIYTLTLINATCSATISTTIQYAARPNPSFTFTLTCNTIELEHSNSVDNHTFFWEVFAKSYHLYLVDNRQISLSNTVTDTYKITLTATSTQGCSASSTQNIMFTPSTLLSKSNLALPDLCLNNPIVLLDNYTSIKEHNNNGIFEGRGVSNKNEFNPQIAGVGKHLIQYTFTNTVGCKTLMQQYIQVKNIPSVSIENGHELTVTSDGIIYLSATTNGDIIDVQWYPTQFLTREYSLKPLARVKDNIAYRITVTSKEGCAATDSIKINIGFLVIPNTFTPNNDGVNDTWDIPMLSSYPNVYIIIFNRFGDIILENNHNNFHWDGTLNGVDVPVGTYYYHIDLHNDSKPLIGMVNIIR